MTYRIVKENLSFEYILNHLISTSSEFHIQETSQLKKYATKLFESGEAAICKDENETIIGLCLYYANIVPTIFITHFWVSKDNRGKDIAGNLLSFLRLMYTDTDFSNVELEVYKSNISALRAYQKFGFIVIAETENKFRLGTTL